VPVPGSGSSAARHADTTDPADLELVAGFIRHLDEGRYDALIDRTGRGDFKPMVLDDTTGRRLLYFQKFHYHERRLKQRLISFLSLPGDVNCPVKPFRL
jgi:hypothetical protein